MLLIYASKQSVNFPKDIPFHHLSFVDSLLLTLLKIRFRKKLIDLLIMKNDMEKIMFFVSFYAIVLVCICFQYKAIHVLQGNLSLYQLDKIILLDNVV